MTDDACDDNREEDHNSKDDCEDELWSIMGGDDELGGFFLACEFTTSDAVLVVDVSF